MNTAQLLPPPITEPPPGGPPLSEAARISFRQPVSESGFIDAGWWPRSHDLTAELPPLLDVLWTAAREITRITYHLAAWDPAPRRMRIDGRTVRLGGFATGDPLTVTLSDASGRERIDVLVIAHTTDPALAQRALRLASEAGSPYRASEILTRAADPAGGRPAGSQSPPVAGARPRPPGFALSRFRLVGRLG
jgi:hypothetical protein